jgi:hypothetical protein
MNWRGYGRKRQWYNCNVLSMHLPADTEENHENNLSL